jgi:hypothetical protein
MVRHKDAQPWGWIFNYRLKLPISEWKLLEKSWRNLQKKLRKGQECSRRKRNEWRSCEV